MEREQASGERPKPAAARCVEDGRTERCRGQSSAPREGPGMADGPKRTENTMHMSGPRTAEVIVTDLQVLRSTDDVGSGQR